MKRRFLLSALLMAGAMGAALIQSAYAAAAAAAAGFMCQWLIRRSVKKIALAAVPVLILIVTMAALQWFNHAFNPLLPAKIPAVFWLAGAGVRLTPWTALSSRCRPASGSSRAIIYLFFVRHFASIVAAESRCLMHARRQAVPRPYGRWSFRSLAAALVSLFGRTLARAERFHAAQLLKGFPE